MTSDWRLRPAVRTDAERVAAIFISSRLAAMHYLPRLYTDLEVLEWIKAIVLRNSLATLAVSEDGRAGGFASIHGGVLEHLYVAPQAETLAIVAYLQPVSRPEIARIRGVSAESAAATLLERGMIEEAGRSQFGAILYRTTDLFLRLFGLTAIGELPGVEQFDPAPEVEAELRERLLRAGEAGPGVVGRARRRPEPEPEPKELDDRTTVAR